MITIRLKALEHPTPDAVDLNDRKAFASTVLWLEDQKIRHYKIEDRKGLRTVDNLNEWELEYTKYKKALGIPNLEGSNEEICWLLNHAVRLEYLDANEKYKSIDSKSILQESVKANEPSTKPQNVFDTIDFSSTEFIAGVRTLATKLQIPYHPDHLVTLEAIKRIIYDRLGKTASNILPVEGTPFPFEEGNDLVCEDSEIELPARILRLLQIQCLRELQTHINETIAAIQELTADPKTDTNLGKVGF